MTSRSEKALPMGNDSTSKDNLKHIEACREPAIVQPRVKSYIYLQSLRSSFRELRSPRLWRDVICEVLVTFLLLFFITGAGFNFRTPENPTTPLLLAGLLAGVIVFALIECFGHIQLASMNPAVCVLFTLTGRMSVVKAFLMISAECLGAILGSALVYSCAPPVARMNFHPLTLHADMAAWQGVIIECVITACLVMVIAAATDDRNRTVYRPGLPIGMTVAAGILLAGNFTGGALNPMITFGPAVVTGIWKYQWVYWAGPMAGAFVGTLFYHGFTYDGGVFRKPETQEEVILTKSKQGDYVACASNEPNQNNNANHNRSSS